MVFIGFCFDYYIAPNRNKQRESSANHQLLQDLTIQLECAQNELAVIQLEKHEYEKEVYLIIYLTLRYHQVHKFSSFFLLIFKSR